MESPTNGRIICDIKDSKHICTPYCDPGFVLDVIEPGEYFTCAGGSWTPNIKPKCLGE